MTESLPLISRIQMDEFWGAQAAGVSHSAARRITLEDLWVVNCDRINAAYLYAVGLHC